MTITPEQQKIINLSEGQHLVLAPPGTGKTELLSHRVDLALNNHVPPEEIICLTFTNRAAKAMKERIEVKHSTKGLFIGNIHNFCSNFLFRNKLLSQFTSVLDDEDSNLLLQEAISLEDPLAELKPYELLKLNTYIKQTSLDFPDDLLMPPKDLTPENELAKNVCIKYEQLKEESSLLDFDDLLTLTYYNLLNSTVEYELTKYSWIQVDEAQDINPIQWEILKLIATENAHIVYFGDYEQSIFSFTGASLDRLPALEKTCKVHNDIQENFRSPSYLIKIFVDYAKRHLSPSWKRDPFSKTVTLPQPGDLSIYQVPGTTYDEAAFITANLVSAYIKEQGKQTAILIRTNKTAEIVSNKLSESNIEHFCISGFDLFSRKLTKDILAFLSCISNPFDRVSWFRLFNIFGKTQSLKESRHFVNLILEHGFLPSDFLNSSASGIFVFEEFLHHYKNDRVVVFDTETTGLNTETDDIIQIAAVEIIQGVIGETFEVYIQTDKSLAETEHVHHITNEYLDLHAIPSEEALTRFKNFVNGNPLIAHNLNYDLEILKSNNNRQGIETSSQYSAVNFDTLEITRRLFPKQNSYKLEYLIETFKIEGVNSHNALDDVKATANLIQFLLPRIENLFKAQLLFAEEHERILLRFRSNLLSLWLKIQATFNLETTFRAVIDLFLSHSNLTVNYEIEQGSINQIEKLLVNMDNKCGSKLLKTLLQKDLPHYKTCKESDLITDNDKVVISTIHKAKGLEFDNVIIPECVNDIYPHYYSKTAEAITEDARLIYVGLTRSKKRLILTSHTISVNQWGKAFPRSRSYFLDSILHHFTNSPS